MRHRRRSLLLSCVCRCYSSSHLRQLCLVAYCGTQFGKPLECPSLSSTGQGLPIHNNTLIDCCQCCCCYYCLSTAARLVPFRAVLIATDVKHVKHDVICVRAPDVTTLSGSKHNFEPPDKDGKCDYRLTTLQLINHSGRNSAVLNVRWPCKILPVVGD